MRQISGKELCAILEKYDWILRRINGSHYIYSKPNLKIRISVPVHANKPLKFGLLKSLIKLSEISEDEFK